MPEQNGLNGRERLLYVFRILFEYSDEEHPLNSNDIIEKLDILYDIKAERKAIYKDINSLKKCDIDIEKAVSQKEGFYLASRSFETAEIRLLVDAILSAKFITRKKTRELTNKLYAQLSHCCSESIKVQVYYDNRVKFSNEQIYYAVDIINRAISEGKKVAFTYHHKVIKYNKVKNDKGRHFIISPYALFWAQDRYYVVGNYDKYDDTSKYRLDKMSNVEIINENIRSFEEVTSYTGHFDTADYVNKCFMMFDGKEDTIELICDISLLEAMYDYFGEKARFTNVGEDKFKVKAKAFVSEGLESWLLSYCNKCYILYPNYLRENIIRRAAGIVDYLSECVNGVYR